MTGRWRRRRSPGQESSTTGRTPDNQTPITTCYKGTKVGRTSASTKTAPVSVAISARSDPIYKLPLPRRSSRKPPSSLTPTDEKIALDRRPSRSISPKSPSNESRTGSRVNGRAGVKNIPQSTQEQKGNTLSVLELTNEQQIETKGKKRIGEPSFAAPRKKHHTGSTYREHSTRQIVKVQINAETGSTTAQDNGSHTIAKNADNRPLSARIHPVEGAYFAPASTLLNTPTGYRTLQSTPDSSWSQLADVEQMEPVVMYGMNPSGTQRSGFHSPGAYSPSLFEKLDRDIEEHGHHENDSVIEEEQLNNDLTMRTEDLLEFLNEDMDGFSDGEELVSTHRPVETLENETGLLREARWPTHQYTDESTKETRFKSEDATDMNSRDPSNVSTHEAHEAGLSSEDTYSQATDFQYLSKDGISDPGLLLSNKAYGIPESVLGAFQERGITSLLPWQMECLLQEGVLDGKKNVLYSAPTSAGKSMVADILMLNKVIKTKRKAIMIVPFVAIASEKTREMQKILASENLNIVGYYSDVGSSSFDDVNIAYCTTEKANSLINKLLEERKLDSLGIVVVDELHMAGDPSRGYLLELLLTKLKFLMKDDLQLVGMSATLPNFDLFQGWLDAHLYVTHDRPVPLTEHIKYAHQVYDVDGRPVHTLKKNHPLDADMLGPLVQPVIDDSASVLIFCSSKKHCESTATFLAQILHDVGDEETKFQRLNVVRELERATPAKPDEVLPNLIMKGIAFHHSGVLTQEKEIIEDAYRAGIIRVMTCTSTLAMGVNLPARRVIFRDMKIGRNHISAREYQQMKGRAGRKGLDSYGECYLMCAQSADFERAQKLVQAGLDCVTSCLMTELKGMKRALLEVIVAGVANIGPDFEAYLQATLLYAEIGVFSEELRKCIDGAICFLCDHAFILWNPGAKRFEATKLGIATVASALAPEEAHIVYLELDRSSANFVLKDELHTVYHVTPPYVQIEVDWNQLRSLYMNFTETSSHIAHLLGIQEHVLYSSARRSRLTITEQRTYSRFYTALVLNDLVQEKAFDVIMKRFPNLTRGMLQTLQNQSATFAGQVKIFCEKMAWDTLGVIVTHFQARLNFGVAKDLVDLVQVPHIGASHARSLYKAGYKNVASLACASVDEIFDILHKALPFRLRNPDHAEGNRRILYREAHIILNGAIEIVQTQIKDAATEAERKKKLLTGARELRTPASSGTKGAISGRLLSSTASLNSYRTLGRLQKAPKTRSAEASSPPYHSNHLRESNHADTIREQKRDLPDNDRELKTPPEQITKSALSDEFSIVNVTDTQEHFDMFIKQWGDQREYVWSSHTKPFDSKRRLVGLSICWQRSKVYFLDPVGGTFSWDVIRVVFGQRSTKICFNTKKQLHYLMQNCVLPAGDFDDPKVAAWCLEPDSPEPDLKKMFNTYFPGQSFSDVGPPEAACARKTIQTYLLMHTMRKRLDNQGLLDYYERVEMKIAPILARMEYIGVGFVHLEFHKYWKVFTEKLEELEQQAYKVSGYTFSLTNPNQVAGVLYDKLQLSYEETIAGRSLAYMEAKKKDNGKPILRSTCKEVLLKLAAKHEFPCIIMEHRRISKLLSTHLVPLRHSQIMDKHLDMARIHCTFDTHTATGRMVAKDPNLQNVPHPTKGPTECGLDIDSANLRNAFQAAEGMVLVSADYSQVELRIIAHLSQDKSLLEIVNSGDDFFKLMASKLHGKPQERITYEGRARAKAISYGVMYGRGARSLSEELEVDLAGAEAFLREFQAAYPGVPAWKQRTIQKCHEKGYVETILGRRRYLPGIHENKLSDRTHAERQAVNTTVQGSSADLVKVAMIHVDKAFRHRGWDSWISDPDNVRKVPHLVLQIHDELLFEVPINLVDEVKSIIVDCMRQTFELDVPLPVRMKMGKQWGSLK
ncbi:DNA-directed DNA polymerase [Spizellomyces sp. 'palustris']|nr:DNA-directed DNA polymerase [Spizellomyces sp. 'palustris']